MRGIRPHWQAWGASGVGIMLLCCQPRPGAPRRDTAQREFHLAGPALIALVRPQNGAGRPSGDQLRFLDQFERASDSLERTGWFVGVTFQDTILVIPPADSFHLSPWHLSAPRWGRVAYAFVPGREPLYLPDSLTRRLLVEVLQVEQRWPRPARIVTVRPMPLAFRALTTGSAHSCGLAAGGKAFCWGTNGSGQLGTGTTSDTTRPTPVAGRLRFVELSAGGSHTCGRTAEGRAFCWGGNSRGQLGDGTRTDKATPVAVAGGLRFAALSAGDDYTCGRTVAGAPVCWGANGHGQLGDGTTTDRTRPTTIARGLGAVAVTAGVGHTCARTAAGQAFCWGFNWKGAVGDGTTGADKPTPAAVAGGLRFVELSPGGYYHTCGRTAAGAAFCWGYNNNGTLGDSTTVDHFTPVAVAGARQFVAITTGYYHACARTAAGQAFCWGGSNNGERGDGVQGGAPVSAPSPVAGGLRFVELRAGGVFTCGRTQDGAAFCWGWNDHGQLGDGTRSASQGPVQVVARP